MQAFFNGGQKILVPLLLFRSVAGLEEIQKVTERLSSLTVREVARERLVNRLRSLITVNADQLYQEVFAQYIMGINSRESRLRQGMEKNLQRLLHPDISCIALSQSVSIALFRFERHRSKMLQSLMETKEIVEKNLRCSSVPGHWKKAIAIWSSSPMWHRTIFKSPCAWYQLYASPGAALSWKTG